MKHALKCRRRTGSVIVEFTFSIIFLLALFLGTWAFGYTFYQYAQLENAVRSGARYASQLNYDSKTATPSPSFLTAVQNMTVYGDPAADSSTATPVVNGLSPGNVNLAVTLTNGAPSAMTVSITGFQVNSYINKVTLNGKPYVWFPYTGYWTPPSP
jgi:Flp pilus assembly protein TadG